MPTHNFYSGHCVFQFKDELFFARSRNTRACAEMYFSTSHKEVRSFIGLWRIDADLSRSRRGIAASGSEIRRLGEKRAIYGWKLIRLHNP